MKKFSDEELQAIAFGDAEAPALTDAQRESAMRDPRYRRYRDAAATLRALAGEQPPGRPGLAVRVRGRIAERRAEPGLPAQLLKVARFEVPALAAAAAVLLFLGVRVQERSPAPASRTYASEIMESAGGAAAGAVAILSPAAQEETQLWPAEDTDVAWAAWVLGAGESEQ